MSVSSDAPPDTRHDLPWPVEPDAVEPQPHGPPVAGAGPVAPAAHASMPIGRIRRADPVELWRSDEFAAWLGTNLDEVSSLLGVKLSPAAAGAASPGTIVATDPAGGQVRVVVELGTSSDETFGVLMRQLVASGAKTAIWVCAQARDEHLTSVEWLNREIAGQLHVVTVEAVRIDDSVPAPVFRLALRAGARSKDPAAASNGAAAPA